MTDGDHEAYRHHEFEEGILQNVFDILRVWNLATGAVIYDNQPNSVLGSPATQPLLKGNLSTQPSKLKKEKGKDICLMGGGVLARSLFEADLIDEVGINVHPVLLGSGIPLFHEMTKQINLKLMKCQELKNGCVALTYKVKH